MIIQQGVSTLLRNLSALSAKILLLIEYVRDIHQFIRGIILLPP